MEDQTYHANAQGIRAIMQTECHSAFQYTERLIKLLAQDPGHKQKLARWQEETCAEIFDLLRLGAFQEEMGLDPFHSQLDFNQLQSLILALAPMPFPWKRYLDLFCPIVNTLYQRAQTLQQWCDQSGKEATLQPRMAILRAWTDDKQTLNGRELGRRLDQDQDFHFGQLRYFLNVDDILAIPESERQGSNQTIAPLEQQRQRKYRQMIDEGMRSMQTKSYGEGLEKFKKAAQFKITAESFNLMAWAYSQMQNNSKAKEHCLKAMQIDRDYGPAYNDYGVYLMNEGGHAEALTWFDQAKRAPNYDNREFPYINCGRIYLQQQQYSLALKEFSEAMRLAPQHRQLKDMVAKLARALVRQAQRDLPIDFDSESPSDSGPWPI